MGKGKKKSAADGSGVIVTNRKARRDYTILEVLEAGIELLGTEVKALRDKRGNLNDSYAVLQQEEVFVKNMHISAYEFGNINNHEPLRVRKLLLHRKEIKSLIGLLQQQGVALIPLKLYFNKRGKVKLSLGVAKGKKLYDKRETIKKREADRQMEKALRRRQQ